MKLPLLWPTAPRSTRFLACQKFKEGKKGIEMNSILLAPNPITKDNLGDVISAGWLTKEEACAGVAAGSVAACN